MYHCHVEATEHMQMGMLGNLYVRPAQNVTRRLPAGTRMHLYAYNDRDGTTDYDAEYALQLVASTATSTMRAGRCSRFRSPDAGPVPDDQRPRLPRHRREPARGPTDAGRATNQRLRRSQIVDSKIVANQGDRVLLRLSNLGITAPSP